MTAQSFTFNAGEDVEIPIAIVDGNGDAADLSGASARFVAARRVGATPAVDSDADDSSASIDGSTVTVTIPDTLTDGLAATYAWEVKITASSGGERVAAYGYMTARPSLTSGS